MGELVAVTGGTGLLGRVVVARLAAMGTPVRVLSRRPKPTVSPGSQWATVDLDTGAGIHDSLDGAGAIIHCATAMRGAKDVVHAQVLATAAQRASCRHLVYVSIVGLTGYPSVTTEASWQPKKYSHDLACRTRSCAPLSSMTWCG